LLKLRAEVLIIEDEREMAELIAMYLQKEGVATKICESAEQGLEIVKEHALDLVVLDINLPGIDGFEFLQVLRKKSSVPVIIVSAREGDEDIILGLGIGADEFVTKPFPPKVLVARIRALLRRSRSDSSRSSESGLLHFGPYSLNIEGCLLRKGSTRIPLSSKEFDVLKYLVVNCGKALTPEVIYREVWGNKYGDLTTVAVYIQRIRKKIEENPSEPIYLQTIHGKGYRFNPETLISAKGS
jgi:two-component system response regulator RegX3